MKYRNVMVMVEYGLKDLRGGYRDRTEPDNWYGGYVQLTEEGLYIWSGLGDEYSYGFLVKIKSEQHLRDLLDNLGFERIE